MSSAYQPYNGEGSPHFGRRYDNGQGRVGNAPSHNTSGWTTTSYSESQDDYTRDASYHDTSHDVTFSQKAPSHRDVTLSRRGDMSSENTDGPTSYDFWPDPKIEWSCEASGGYQKLSFLLLVFAFIGHGIAVCIPYYVMGWNDDQLVLHEGVWLSCYRERGYGRWICGTYDSIRGIFQQPEWHEASQIMAVLSAILLIPTLIVATLYSYVDSLRGRPRASWILIVFASSIALCSFLSIVIFGAAYPYKSGIAETISLSYSYVIQILGFLALVLSILTHVKDSHSYLKKWEEKPGFGSRPSNTIELPRLPRAPNPFSSKEPATTKASKFALPKFPSALSRFRSKGSNDQAPRETTAPIPELEKEPGARRNKEMDLSRDASDGAPGKQNLSVPGRAGEKSSYRSYAASNSSLSTHSQV